MSGRKLLNITVSLISAVSLVFSAGAFPVFADADSVTGKITLKQDSRFKIIGSKKILCGIDEQTSVSDLIGEIGNTDGIAVYYKNGNEASGNISTGCSVSLNLNGQIADKLNCIVYGDVNGDSNINAADLLNIKRVLLSLGSLDDAEKEAADVNKDGSDVNASDLIYLKRSLLQLSYINNSAWYYVSKQGSDNNDGSISYPFATIGKAAKIMTAGDTCFIRGGKYNEEVRVTCTGEDGAPVTFKAYENEAVTVSAMETVTSPWVQYKDNIYKTDITLNLGYENQILIDGKAATLARYPNKGTDNFISVGETLEADSASASSLSDSSLNLPDSTAVGANIAIEGTNHYIYYTSDVTSQQGGQVKFNAVASGWDSPTAKSRYYFYNSLNFLDCADEWYYSNGALYVMTSDGKSPAEHNIQYKERMNVFDVSGSPYITISGINTVGAQIRNNSQSRHLTLDKMNISHYYHTSKARYYPWDADFYGIELNGDYSTIKNSEISYGAECGIEIKADHCSVVNNYIHDIGYMNSNAAAITPRYADFTLIAYNTIENTARSAITLLSTNLRVTHNKIANFAVNMSDTSAIGSYKTDAMYRTEVDHNIVCNSANKKAAVAYYIDNGSMNYIFHHNVAYNVDSAMIMNNPSYGNKIYNNTLVGDGNITSGALSNPYDNNKQIGADWSGNQIYNNILTGLFYGDHAFMGKNLYCNNPNIKFSNKNAYDYSLQSGSSAINAGIKLPVGTEKFVGSAPDIGAYEYGGEQWSAGCDLTRNMDIEYSLSDMTSGFTPTYSLPFADALPPTAQNLLLNGGFENGLTDWNTSANASVGNYYPVSGTASVKLDNAWVNKDFAATAGQVYYLSGTGKYIGTSGFLEFGVHFMDNNYNILSQASFYITNQDYMQKASFVTVPANATRIRIYAASWDSKSTAYIDDIVLKKVW